MSHYFEKCIVRIRDNEGNVMGSGFLTKTRQVITCAHVVSRSFGLLEVPGECPIGEIHLDFPLVAPEQGILAKVIEWKPDARTDLALLEISGELPQNAYMASLSRPPETATHNFSVCGFPEGKDYGIWSFGKILGSNARGYIQIQSETSYTVKKGFSGSLVWDTNLRRIVGIISETDNNVSETKTAYYLPVDTILDNFPHLESSLDQATGGFKHACFISYPNDEGQQGALTKKIARAIYESLSEVLGSMLELKDPVCFKNLHNDATEDIARELCESACLVMILSPKYFSEKKPLCTLEFKAMKDLEAQRVLPQMELADDISLLIPVMMFSRDILPMKTVGQRRDYDFRNAIVAGDLVTHPHYGPLVTELAEHIFKCFTALEGHHDEPCSECSDFRLPTLEQVQDILQSASNKKHLHLRLPTR